MTIQPSTGTSSLVARQLRDLNSETRVLQAALNQAQASVNHAVRLVELQYHQKRKEILNGHADEDAL